jgi:hypothetical protein
MGEYLFTIDDIFHLDKRGIILAPGAPYHCSIHVGEYIELRQQDGSRVITSILALEHLNYPLGTPMESRRIPIMIAATIEIDVTLIGAEVWRTQTATSGP